MPKPAENSQPAAAGPVNREVVKWRDYRQVEARRQLLENGDRILRRIELAHHLMSGKSGTASLQIPH